MNERELQRLPIDQLDRMAFGVQQGVQRLPLDQIRIRYAEDYQNALDYVVEHPEDYRDALDTEPVEVRLERGVYWLQDGHHRYVTAQLRGDRDILADLTIRDSPVVALMRRTTAYNRQYRPGPLQHRRQTSRLPTGNVLLFSDDERRNRHYGPHVWTLVTELPEVPDRVVRFAQQYYDVDEEEARELVDPPDIVDSAGAWDNPEFVYEVWERFEDPGYRTYDGAVVLDRDAVELLYRDEIAEE